MRNFAVLDQKPHIQCRQPSRHEEAAPEPIEDKVYAGSEAVLEGLPAVERAKDPQKLAIQGGRQLGIIMHKLIEEVLTGETEQEGRALEERAAELLAQLGLTDEQDPAVGPSSKKMADAVHHALQLPEIAALRSRLLPELPVYANATVDKTSSLTAGTADAAAIDSSGRIDTVIDWKRVVDPTSKQIEIYRGQVREYLKACGADAGLVVFLTSGRIERMEPQKK